MPRRIVGAHLNGDRLALCVGKGDRRLVEAVLDQRLIAYERGPGLVTAVGLLRNQGQVVLERTGRGIQAQGPILQQGGPIKHNIIIGDAFVHPEIDLEVFVRRCCAFGVRRELRAALRSKRSRGGSKARAPPATVPTTMLTVFFSYFSSYLIYVHAACTLLSSVCPPFLPKEIITTQQSSFPAMNRSTYNSIISNLAIAL